MDEILRVLSLCEAAEFSALGLLAILQWRRRGGASRGWLAGTFGSLGLVLIIGQFFAAGSPTPSAWVVKPVLALIVVFPYLLYRFMRSMGGSPRSLNAMAAGVTGALLAVTILLPRFADPSQPRPAYLQAYGLMFVVQWLLLAGAVAVRLWRAGKGQPTLARRRMRTLSLGSATLVIVAVVSASNNGHTSKATVTALVLAALSVASGPLFLAGFAPPQVLIRMWRRREEADLQAAVAELMGATDAAEVLRGLLPRVASIVGAQSAAVFDAEGQLLGSHGDPPADGPEVADGPRHRRGEGMDQRVELALPTGKLIVWASPYTPYFGRYELELLQSLSVMASMALERCEMFLRERTTLEALEEAQRIAQLGSWRWRMATNQIEWSNELYRIHGVNPSTFQPSVEGLQTFCHPDDREARMATIQDAVAAGAAFDVEYRIVLADGQVRSLQGLGKLRRDSRGAPVEMIGTVQDVTERRRLETLRTEFIANAAHELRTPLTTITGMAMVLAGHRSELDEAVADEAFEALGRQGERARVLINNMLDLSQLEANRIPIHLEEVELAEIVTRARETVSPPEGTTVEIDISERLCALADSARLEQVVTNLLSNAYRYGGRHVRVEASRSSGRVLLTVIDDGPGVPHELVSSIFEPFTRGRGVSGTIGSGLGLAISRRLVDAFQGRMTYEHGVPHGSRFVVELRAAA
jgi:signal transduction histidine kinase